MRVQRLQDVVLYANNRYKTTMCQPSLLIGFSTAVIATSSDASGIISTSDLVSILYDDIVDTFVYLTPL